MDADQLRENLIGYVLGALDGPEHSEVEARVRRSVELEAEVERIRSTMQTLRDATPRVPSRAGLADRTCRLIESITDRVNESHLPSGAQQNSEEHEGRSASQPLASSADGNSGRMGVPVGRPLLDAMVEEAVRSEPAEDVPPQDPARQASSPPPTAALAGSASPPSRRRFRRLRGDSRPAGDGPTWHWVDVLAMGGVAVLVFSMLIPAIHTSRFQSRIVTCQDNLRRVGQSLAEYAAMNDDRFPAIPERGNLAVAGVYAPLLQDSELLPDPSILLCPDSVRADEAPFRVPSVAEVESMRPGPALDAMHHKMGGSYAYSLGHVQEDKYLPPQNLDRSYFPILSDSPAQTPSGLRTLHHGGIGQNVLFEDGHVRFVSTPTVLHDDRTDHVFLNDSGVVAAGTHPKDAVLGASFQSPIHLISSHTNQ